MSLWYDCGHGMAQSVGFARSNLGADLYLCCPGPSLKTVDPASLHVPGAWIVALNTAYPRIRPDLWIGMDTPACYAPQLFWEPFAKICRGPYHSEKLGGVPIKTCPGVYFADVETAPALELFKRRAHHVKFVWNNNSFVVALHVAVWMGAKRIHLVGCDFGGSSDYHDDRKLSDAHRERNRLLYGRLVGLLPKLRDAAKPYGIELISCTPDSPANAHLPYLPLADALKRSSERVPSIVGADVLYTLDAFACRWGKKPVAGDGILTGTDAAQEWLLPWFYERLRKHNPTLEVAFADFGMSTIMKRWCADRGKLIRVCDVPGLTWHRKPFALLATPFERTTWLDADCEVRGDLTPLFPFAERGMGLTLDPCNRRCKHATGVVVVTHGEAAVNEWCKEIITHRHHRGDQEALEAIKERLTPRLAIMPPEYQWVRLQGDINPQAIIMHWTGPDGKKIIAAQKCS